MPVFFLIGTPKSTASKVNRLRFRSLQMLLFADQTIDQSVNQLIEVICIAPPTKSGPRHVATE